MENENQEIQKQWKRDRLILGVVTLIIPIRLLIRLYLVHEYPLYHTTIISFENLREDILYFSIAAFDMGRLKINTGLKS